MTKRTLIAFEGLPGGGKTTIAKMVADYLNAEFMEEIVTHDKFLPSEDIYYIESELIKLDRYKKMTKNCAVFDRSLYSMIAYNFGRKGLGQKNILEQLNLLALETKKPDLFVYLRINNISLCNQRKNRVSNEQDIWTQEKSLIHIRNFYEKFFAQEKKQITIDTDDKPVEEVFKILTSRIKKYV